MECVYVSIPATVIRKGAKLPAYSREGDACMDCYAAEDITIPPLTLEEGCGRATVPLGFKVALLSGTEALIRPRSGLALKSGITVLNTPGTIDENYRGEVCAILVNTTAKPFEVKKGDRVCQMAVRPIFTSVRTDGAPVVIKWAEYSPEAFEDAYGETNRGEKGFGSSGK